MRAKLNYGEELQLRLMIFGGLQVQVLQKKDGCGYFACLVFFPLVGQVDDMLMSTRWRVAGRLRCGRMMRYCVACGSR